MKNEQDNATTHKANRQATELIQMYREKDMTYQDIVDRLNSHGFTTRRGKKFFSMTVQRLHVHLQQSLYSLPSEERVS